MNFSIFILLIAIVFLTGQAAIFSSYPAYQNSNWHYDNYGNLMIGNRDNGFYMGPCFGPEYRIGSPVLIFLETSASKLIEPSAGR
ncbi:hypothetical protein L3Y34_013571 [Caenorhabditis briggsae]|uniref:Uncharacterized protein n=1 Tax=Caenorhabditis briggsae TaxID=6238 RepID=A0AAE8ZVI6_CAEBR|nr:hypothetical protein L3Y34_013571 [Caenorhabditis briggsae]